MAKLYFRYGAMGSSKTANAIMVWYNYHERCKKALLVKPGVDTRDGVVCPGEILRPVLMVSQQARVQVYSVARDGRGFLVWPPPGDPGLVDSLLDLGEFAAVETPDHGDERLVAVAVPAGAYFGKTEGWTGFCRLSGVFGPVLYPAGAALGAATWRVLPAGMGGCTGAARAADLAALDTAAVCGE